MTGWLPAVALGLALLDSSRPAASDPRTPPPQTPPPPTQPPVQNPQPIFRVTSDVVAVDVSVIDNDGRPVRGLQSEDFTVKVDGSPRRIVSTEFVSQTAAPSAGQPEEYSTNEEMAGGRLIMLVIDQGNISQGDGRPVLSSAQKFLATLNRSDRVGLAVIPGPIGRIDFTAHHALVQQRLNQVAGLAARGLRNFKVGIAESLAVDRGDESILREIVERECASERTPEGREVCQRQLRDEARGRVQAVRQQTNTSIVALRGLFGRLQKIEGPKTLILISEGLIVGRDLGSLSWLAPAAAAARASVYALRLEPTVFDASRMTMSPTAGDDRELQIDGLNHLTRLARGAVFTIGPNADATFSRLAMELTGYYLLAVEPIDGDRDGKPHEIKVEVNRRSLTVRARREFVAGAATLVGSRSDEEALTEALQTPLIATDLRVKVTTFSYEDSATGRLRLLVSADVGGAPDDAPMTAAGFMLTDDDGRVVVSSYDPAPLAPVDDRQVRHYLGVTVVDAGTYLLKLAVRDQQGRLGSVEHSVKARLTSVGEMQVGDLLLSEIPADGQHSIRPIIDPTLRFNEVIGYLEVYSKNAEQLRNTTVRLEIAADGTGPSLANAPAPLVETKSSTRRIAQGSISLKMLPPGQYVARAVVSVNNRPTARTTRPFYLSAAAVARGPSTRLGTGAESGAPKPMRPAASSPAARAGAFERIDVLHSDVIRPYLDRLAQLDQQMAPAVTSAIAHARDGRFDRAFDQLHRLPHDSVAVPFLQGLALFQRGDLEGAAARFRDALRVSSEFMPAAVYLGACYAAGGHDQQAIGAWQTALAAEDDTPVIHALLGDALVRIGEPAQAIATLQEASTTFPDDDRIKRRLGSAYAAAGKPGDALAILDPYLARHAGDLDALFLAMRLVYEAGARSRPLASAAEDLQRFGRYARAYAAAKGPQQELVTQWQTYLELKKR